MYIYIYINVRGTEHIKSRVQLHKTALNIFFQYYAIKQIFLITFVCKYIIVI